MPQDTKQTQAKKSVNPSPGFFKRWFGSEEFSPEMQSGIDIAKKEMPDMAPVRPYGLFSRLAQPNALGYVSPSRNIYLNPSANAGQTPQEIADTLTHEQEHVKQSKSSGYGPTMSFLKSMLSGNSLPYSQRPDEMGAFQAEKERRHKMGRTQAPIPSFSNPGQFNIPLDINLPNESRKPVKK